MIQKKEEQPEEKEIHKKNETKDNKEHSKR